MGSILDLIKTRVSCRDYLEQPVPEELISSCLEAARWAPSACNRQPWRFVVVRDQELRHRLCDEGLLPGIPMKWARQAPLIVALCVKKSFATHTLAPMISGISYQLLDAGIAGEHLVLEAHAQGLGSCWIGWIKPRKVRKLLALPSDITPVSLLTLGYPRTVAQPSKRLDPDEIAWPCP